MKTELNEIIEKIRVIRENGGDSQESMAEKMGITQSKYARFERGTTKTDLNTLVIFCNVAKMTLKEFFLYPEKPKLDDIKAQLTIELKKEKKDQVLKLVFGDNNLEILNK